MGEDENYSLSSLLDFISTTAADEMQANTKAVKVHIKIKKIKKTYLQQSQKGNSHFWHYCSHTATSCLITAPQWGALRKCEHVLKENNKQIFVLNWFSKRSNVKHCAQTFRRGRHQSVDLYNFSRLQIATLLFHTKNQSVVTLKDKLS